ncbi:transposase [Paenibacillus sp. OAS669]|uniref:transposase n=1 Tax=Paenibacillus sp. OAS669 TaxID=2663821 RepID=UPI0039A10868
MKEPCLTLFYGSLEVGAAWRDLPEERYGSWKTVYSRFCKRRDTGLLVAIFQTLQVEPDFENLSIDSTSVKAHQHSAGAKKTPQDNTTT